METSTATVVWINRIRDVVVAQSDEGFVVFELLGSYDIEVGHTVIHPDFTSHGGETYRNAATGEKMDVYVQALCPSLEAAKKHCM